MFLLNEKPSQNFQRIRFCSASLCKTEPLSFAEVAQRRFYDGKKGMVVSVNPGGVLSVSMEV
jgi:hypothetical protein